MDLKAYYSELSEKEAELLKGSGKNKVVYVTSKFYRERNSTPGSTVSATPANAARVITDGTHQLATQEEIAKFIKHQNDELTKNIRAEQSKKQQYVVVTSNAKAEFGIDDDGDAAAVANAAVVPAQKGTPEKK
jgi:hypothetical protein